MRNADVRSLGIALLAVTLGGCVASGEPAPQSYGYPSRPLPIPQGHMPPPDECRIWFPDLPPGKQPPPGDCYDLRHRVPPGAILVRG
jgi:hypothetical protein